MRASAPAYAPDRRAEQPRTSRRPVVEPVEREARTGTPANGYDGIPEEVVCGPTPAAKRKRLVICFGLATLLMLIATPWPGMANGRPLFRVS